MYWIVKPSFANRNIDMLYLSPQSAVIIHCFTGAVSPASIQGYWRSRQQTRQNQSREEIHR